MYNKRYYEKMRKSSGKRWTFPISGFSITGPPFIGHAFAVPNSIFQNAGTVNP